MSRDSYAKLKKIIQNSEHHVIITHWSPDGDAMGSSLALYHFLTGLGKKASVVVPNDYPEFLNWLPGNARVVNYSQQPEKVKKLFAGADLIYTLDFNSFKRLEGLGDLLSQNQTPKMLIDHHQQPDTYAAYQLHDVKACSTCELVYDLICGLGHKKSLNKKIAACLYTGLMTDTGSFRYPSVNSKTHRILADLLETGIHPTDIHSAVYDSYSYNRLKLLGFALNEKLKILPGLPVAYFTLNEKELERFHYVKGDLEGLVNYPFSIKGIQLCALFNETDEYVKISFRSKGHIDVNKFARRYFNGGGHINAAGGKSMESLKLTEEKFVELVKTLF